MLPKTRRSPHNSPWSSSDDAWSGRKPDSVNHTIILGDDHSAAKPQPRSGPLRHLKDRDALLTFFDFPAEHWTHLRTSNPIESTFATVRHRTVRMKGALSQDTARLMVFKLVMAASKSWRRLQGQNQLPKVVSGVTFRDGIEVASEKKSAA